MVNSRESLSEQSKKRTNYILLAGAFILFVLFLLAWCSKQPKQENYTQPKIVTLPPIKSGNDPNIKNPDIPDWGGRGDAVLVAIPDNVDMKPVIGAEAESIITLRAENAPLKLEEIKLAEEREEEGFELDGSCMSTSRLAKGEDCRIKITWQPTKVLDISNTLTIVWLEDSPRVFNKEHLSIQIHGHSTDSKDCVICPPAGGDNPPSVAIPCVGEGCKGVDLSEPPNKNCVLMDDNGKITGICRGKLIPLSLKNELLGEVDDRNNVIDANGQKLGKVLGNDTIINTKFEVIGKAIPSVLVAMKESGEVFGKIAVGSDSVSIVDSHGKVLGFPHVDGQIIDTEGQQIGFLSPWGGVIDFNGRFLGITSPTGEVIDNKGAAIAYMRPMGIAVDKKGEIVGGIIPRGVGVGAGGNSLGEVSLEGDVKDSFGQVVGRVLLDGSIVDAQMNELGKAVRQGIIIDADGHVLGFVNSEGKAVNFEGKIIGNINPDGTVFANKRFVGAVMPEGRVIKDACQQVGSVYPDGSVVGLTLNKLGHITPEGVAIDERYKELGVVAPWGTAIAEGCRLLGLISLNGNVVSSKGVTMGCVNTDNTVQNLQGDRVGRVTPLGLFVGPQNQIIGRVRLDGQIVDNKGLIVGCSYKTIRGPIVRETQGVIVDANGFSLGASFIGNKAYDEKGNLLGNVYFNGWVISEEGKLIGRVPFSGIIFDDKGQILGNYNQKTGMATDMTGDKLGRVLPGLSVIGLDGKNVLGKLIPTGTAFVGLDGTFLGALRSDGQIVDGAKVFDGILLANGTLVNKEKKLVGGMVPYGPVISGSGKYAGLSTGMGEVVDEQNTKIGRMLANGLAISDSGQVLGCVFPELSVAVSARGFVGFVEPDVLGSLDNPSYQLKVNDTKGNRVGTVSGTGVVLGLNNAVSGRLVPVAPFADYQGKLIGWANFDGGINDTEGRIIGTVLPSGLALDKAQNLIAAVVDNAVAVDTFGAYLGHLSSRGEVLSDRGEVVARIGTGAFLTDNDGVLVGQVLKPGVVVDNNGRFMGWTRYDGQIENGSKVLGQVGLDGHVFNSTGQMIGRYMPLGATVFNDEERSVGFLSDNAEIMAVSGARLTPMGYEPFVMNQGNLVGRFLPESDFVTSFSNGEVLGMATDEGTVMPFNSDKSVGSVKMNGLFVSSHQTKGALVPAGLAVTPTLGLIGREELNGKVYRADKPTGVVTGSGLVYSPKGELVGSILTAGIIIDAKGIVVGQSTGTPAVYNGKAQIGNLLTFGTVLSATSEWVGNRMKTGAVVDREGEYLGAVSSSGVVLGPKDVFVGRVLSDGSVAAVPESSLYNTMPYIGHTVEQGIAIDFEEELNSLGWTTAMGDLMDGQDKKVARVTDNGLSVIKEEGESIVTGRIVPLISAVDLQGNVMGTVMSNGRVISYDGRVQGRVDNEGIVRLLEPKDITETFRPMGIVVPEGLVVNNCNVVGQTAYDGRVINGQGVVVGRMMADKSAIDVNGKKIGHLAWNNKPCVTEDGTYLGRSLPDSTVVDVNGVYIGCATDSGDMLTPKGEKLCKIVKGEIAIDPQTGKRYPIGIHGQSPEGTIEITGPCIGKYCQDCQNGDCNVYDPVDPTHEPIVKFCLNCPQPGVPTVPGTSWNCPEAYATGVGCLKGCDLVEGENGPKIATLMADGSMRDDNGDLYANITPNRVMLDITGKQIAKLMGLRIEERLKQCGITAASKGSQRRVNINDKTYYVDQGGSVLNDENEIIGYLGDDGKLYNFANKQIGLDPSGRKPPEPKQFVPKKEQIEEYTNRLAEKRKSMREKFEKGTLLIPAPELQARAKPKKDKDWSKVGVNKESISTWPVDMSHVVLEGKAIPAVLARSIDSRYMDGSALAIVEKNVYGEEGRNILIPAGSRLIGQASTGEGTSGVAKIEINWNRLIRPDGSAFDLSGSPSGDAQGRGGVAAYLDERLWNKYGAPVMATLATSAVSYLMATNEDASSTTSSSEGSDGSKTDNTTSSSEMSNRSQAMNEARKNFIQTIQQILDQMIEDATEKPPVLYVPAGTRLVVFPKKDLWLRSVEDDEKDAEKEFGAPSSSAQGPNTKWMDKYKDENKQESSGENTSSSDQQTNNSEEHTPIYDGQTDRMPDISDRKVTPVSQEDSNMF